MKTNPLRKEPRSTGNRMVTLSKGAEPPHVYCLGYTDVDIYTKFFFSGYICQNDVTMDRNNEND